jgi:2-polyprenyl-6-methoxyphenol hydroxylase-like FAD-dependent oxidoreductase
MRELGDFAEAAPPARGACSSCTTGNATGGDMYDAIIVGARCAGAPTAMLLARKGYRALLLDKATFPSDTISTHIIWPHGAEVMNRWGLLDRLAATGCPPVALGIIFDVGPFALEGGVLDTNNARGGFCPRRTVLDALLVSAAVEAGAELREAFTVDALLWEGERVAGVRGHGRGGSPVEERARIVIGADGVNSFVAKAAGAPEYDVRPPLTTNYYSYFSGFDIDDIEMYVRDYHAVGCFPTHDGQTLIAVLWPASRFHEIRADVERHVLEAAESAPSVADRLRRARREEKWHGVAGVPNYFRQPFGPGWALVGDAAYSKDPMSAQGISDAFLDADALTGALDDGWSGRRPLAEALAAHQADRDRRVKPMYDFTCELATLEPPPPPLQQLFLALRTNQEATNQFLSAITGSRPLPEFMAPENVGRIIGAAAAAPPAP